MGVKIIGGNSSNDLVDIDALHQTKIVTPQTETNAGFIQASAESDSGDATGSRLTRAITASDDYRTRVGFDQSIFNATFEGTAVNTLIFLMQPQ
jgi:hypothetical protein